LQVVALAVLYRPPFVLGVSYVAWAPERGSHAAKLESKPDVVFDTFFPHPGNYRIWSQFQRGATIITVPFTIYVPRLK